MEDHAKRNEWLEFRAKYPKECDWKDFYKWAEDPKSAFHEDLEWNQKRAAEEYYRKACLNLIIRYDRVFCNVETSYQRLHTTYDAKLFDKGIKQRVAKTAAEIAKNDEELQRKKAAIWNLIRRVTGDIQEFKEYLPEFNPIYEFLIDQVSEVEFPRKSGAAAS